MAGRLHERISDRPDVARRPRDADLRRHQRNHEGTDRPQVVEPTADGGTGKGAGRGPFACPVVYPNALVRHDLDPLVRHGLGPGLGRGGT